MDETKTLLAGGRVLATSLSWCEGMDKWEPLRSSAILAPLFGDALALKKSGPPALPPSLPALQVLMSSREGEDPGPSVRALCAQALTRSAAGP